MAKRVAFIATGLAALLAIGIIIGAVWTGPPERPHTMISSGSEWYSKIDNQRFVVSVSDPDLNAAPSWSPRTPLPLAPEEAIRRATQALAEMSPPLTNWQFSELTLRPETPGRYFFIVTFRPGDPIAGGDFAQFVVYLDGKVGVPRAQK